MIGRRGFLRLGMGGVAFGSAPRFIQAATFQPYHIDTLTSVFGPGLYYPGNKTADGTPFDVQRGPAVVGIAHPWLRLGTAVTVEIAPQWDAWGDGMRQHGALIPTTVIDRGPGVIGADGVLYEFPRRKCDLTMGLLRAGRFFDPAITAIHGDRSEFNEAMRWGVRPVRIHVHD
jgi:hypothetical protein